MRHLIIVITGLVLVACTYNPAPKNLLTMRDDELAKEPRARVCEVYKGGLGNKTITNFIEERRIDCDRILEEERRKNAKKQGG